MIIKQPTSSKLKLSCCLYQLLYANVNFFCNEEISITPPPPPPPPHLKKMTEIAKIEEDLHIF